MYCTFPKRDCPLLEGSFIGGSFIGGSTVSPWDRGRVGIGARARG